MKSLHLFFVVAVVIISCINCSIKYINAESVPTRGCSLSDYQRYRHPCDTTTNERTISYLKYFDASCVGPQNFELGEIEKGCTCGIEELKEVPVSGSLGKCQDGVSMRISGYSSSGAATCSGTAVKTVSGISGDVPCPCTQQDLRGSFTECFNGTRKYVYYWKHQCDDVSRGSAKLPSRSSFSPCTLSCEHGEFAGPLCKKCPAGSYAFLGDKYHAPFYTLPREFVESCYEFLPSGGGARPCSVATLGWRPCNTVENNNNNNRLLGSSASSCITTGDTQGLNSIDVTFALHVDIVRLPAYISVEYRIESEDYFDWFGIMKGEEVLHWDSGIHTEWKQFQYNFSVPAEEMCSWSLGGEVCVEPNQLAPYDPDSFWSPELPAVSDSHPFSTRDIVLLPMKPSASICIDVSAYRSHPGMSLTTPGKDKIFVLHFNSSGGCTPLGHISKITAYVREVGAQGVLFISPSSSIRADTDIGIARGVIIGSITYLPDDVKTVNFISSLFAPVLDSSAGNTDKKYVTKQLRWNRYPGYRVELQFFYVKDDGKSVGKDRVEIKNIVVEGTKKAVSSCQKCDAGFYSALTGAEKCLPCPAGTFSSFFGSKKCTKCPSNTNSAPGSTSCISVSRTCTALDYEAVRHPCHLNSQGIYVQNISYRLPVGISCSVNKAISVAPPSRQTECKNCFYGSYFDTKNTKEGTTPSCVTCKVGQEYVEYAPHSTIAEGCSKCGTGQVLDQRIQYHDFLLFNNTLPSPHPWSRSCTGCLSGGKGFDFAIIVSSVPPAVVDNRVSSSLSSEDPTTTANIHEYEQLSAALEGATVLAVGSNVLSEQSASLSFSYIQEFPGGVEFDFFVRLPILKKSDSPPITSSSTSIDFYVFDVSNPSSPQQILWYPISSISTIDTRISQTPILAPGPKKLVWTYTNNRPMSEPPVIFGLQRLSIRGALDGGSEGCLPCPTGFACPSNSKPVMCKGGFYSKNGESECKSCSVFSTSATGTSTRNSVNANKGSGSCKTCSGGMKPNPAIISNLQNNNDNENDQNSVPKNTFCQVQSANGNLLVPTSSSSNYPTIGNNFNFNDMETYNFLASNPEASIESITRRIGNREPTPVVQNIFNTTFLQKGLLRFPATTRRQLEVSLFPTLPNQTQCLTPHQKTLTKYSFGCARNPISGEEFSIGNYLSIHSIREATSTSSGGTAASASSSTSSSADTGIRIIISGLPCLNEWGPAARQHTTTIDIVCDPTAAEMITEPVTTTTSIGNDCDMKVRARYRYACSFCTPDRMAQADIDCDSSSNQNYQVRNFTWVNDDGIPTTTNNRVATNCYGGYRLPQPIVEKCPWLSSIKLSNAQVIFVALGVLLIVAIIVGIVVYLWSQKSNAEVKYRVLRDTVEGTDGNSREMGDGGIGGNNSGEQQVHHDHLGVPDNRCHEEDDDEGILNDVHDSAAASSSSPARQQQQQESSIEPVHADADDEDPYSES